MDITGKTIWQQASGDTDRDYAGLCLEWGVILNGPGYAGPWPDCRIILEHDGRSARKLTDLARFAEEMKDGDLVVLRIGTSTVLAVGEIVGPYEWHPDFGDVDGWEIQHVRRVRWLWESLNNPKTFETYALKQGDTTQKLSSPEVAQWLTSLHVAEQMWSTPLKPLPMRENDAEVGWDSISEYLFDNGVASDSIAKLRSDVDELVRIARWYGRAEHPPSEHETVAYLVIPLLRALGWTPQRMAVEWNRVDVALFKELPRVDSSLTVVVEAKKMNSSCLSALSQAQSYAQGKTGCQRLFVTDGLRYGIYIRDATGEFQLNAYVNLARLKDSYPVYGCKGAKDALLAMAPEWHS